MAKNEQLNKELAAIRRVNIILDSLDEPTKQRVADYVLRQVGTSAPATAGA